MNNSQCTRDADYYNLQIPLWGFCISKWIARVVMSGWMCTHVVLTVCVTAGYHASLLFIEWLVLSCRISFSMRDDFNIFLFRCTSWLPFHWSDKTPNCYFSQYRPSHLQPLKSPRDLLVCQPGWAWFEESEVGAWVTSCFHTGCST